MNKEASHYVKLFGGTKIRNSLLQEYREAMSLKAVYCINETIYLSHPSLRPVLHAGKATAQFNLPLNSAVSCLFSQFPLFDHSGHTHEYHFPSDVLQCTAVV